MKRTPLRTDPEKRLAWLRASRKPLPLVSSRRKREKPQRDAVRAAVLERDGYECQAAGLVLHVACWGPLDVHEPIPRSAWPGVHLLPDRATSICRGHHCWVDANPAEAHALGLHGYSWERPA